MTAYSFKARFAEPIEQRHKRQTIRADRKRHARPGERIQLYVGMRTKHCRKIIPDPVCVAIHAVKIVYSEKQIYAISVDGIELGYTAMEEFARSDGFDNLHSMCEFWNKEHGGYQFEGVIIKWNDQP